MVSHNAEIESLQTQTHELRVRQERISAVKDAIARARKKRIMIVDDEPNFLFTVRLALEGTRKWDVVTCDGGEAIERARACRPDLILLDCMMPEVSGAELAAQLQNDPALQPIPFAFLTATITTPDAATSPPCRGLQLFLPKLMSLDELDESIELVLRTLR